MNRTTRATSPAATTATACVTGLAAGAGLILLLWELITVTGDIVESIILLGIADAMVLSPALIHCITRMVRR